MLDQHQGAEYVVPLWLFSLATAAPFITIFGSEIVIWFIKVWKNRHGY
jgi:hypothetical protein